MIPQLYDLNVNSLKTKTGNDLTIIGALSDAVSCVVTSGKYGLCELEMQIPYYGRLASKLEVNRVIFVHSPSGIFPDSQFRIYKTEETENGIITVNAEHRGYRMKGVPVKPFSAVSGLAITDAINNNMMISGVHVSGYPSSTKLTFENDKITTLWDLLFNGYDSLAQKADMVATYGNDAGTEVYLGTGSGHVKLYLGKDINSYKVNIDGSDYFTHVLSFWTSEDKATTIYGSIKPVDGYTVGTYERAYPQAVKVRDLSGHYKEQPTVARMDESTDDYIAKRTNHAAHLPNATVTFGINIEAGSTYSFMPGMNVMIDDPIGIAVTGQNMTRYGVALSPTNSIEIQKTKYDVLNDRFTEIEV